MMWLYSIPNINGTYYYLHVIDMISGGLLTNINDSTWLQGTKKKSDLLQMKYL